MYWIDRFKLAAIHRETYAAILRSWVPHGKRGEFARQCGITREYLSCLCAPDVGADGKEPSHKRDPSPEVAKKIAAALPAPNEIKRSLLENMQLAHVVVTEAQYTPLTKLNPPIILQRLSELEQSHREATFGKNLPEVQRSYHIVRDAARDLLGQLNPEEYPESFVQACLYYHDAQCVLNRPDEALRYARIAQHVLESIVDLESGYSREQRDNLEINSIRGEAVAYHNLRLDRKVPAILDRACDTAAYRNARLFWEPLVKRDLINAVVEIPRFSIREVNRVARQIESICEHNNDEFTLLLVREAWLRSFIQRDKTRAAQRLLLEEMERLPHLPYVGALHRALLLKSGARLAWKTKDKEAWNLYITEALSLMHKAGLKHQMGLVRQEYGSAVKPVLFALGIHN